VKVEQSVKFRRAGHLFRSSSTRFHALVPSQTSYSYRYLYSPVVSDLVSTHRPLPQSCYVDSWTSSWLIPVREARHGRDVRCYALYSVHRGVPVKQTKVSHRDVSITSGCKLRGWSYQIACHMLGQGRIELAYAKHCA